MVRSERISCAVLFVVYHKYLKGMGSHVQRDYPNTADTHHGR